MVDSSRAGLERSLGKVLFLILRPSKNWESLNGWVDALPPLAVVVAIGVKLWQGLELPLVALTAAVILCTLALHAAWRRQHPIDTRYDLEDATISELRKSRYHHVGPSWMLNLAEILFITDTLWTKPTSAPQVKESITQALFNVDKVEFGLDAVPAEDILAELVILGVLETRTYDLGAGQGSRRASRWDFPYETYFYSDFGKRIIRRIRMLRDEGKFPLFYDSLPLPSFTAC